MNFALAHLFPQLGVLHHPRQEFGLWAQPVTTESFSGVPLRFIRDVLCTVHVEWPAGSGSCIRASARWAHQSTECTTVRYCGLYLHFEDVLDICEPQGEELAVVVRDDAGVRLLLQTQKLRAGTSE